jgi:hypothetical protein
MANTVIIEVMAKDGATAVLTNIANSFRKSGDSAKISAETMAAAMGITATVVGITATAIVKSYEAYKGLAEQVRDLALVSGTSAENTSRFIQVLDDYQLTAEDATMASKKLKEVGLTPTVETLAELSDKFRAISDPAERLVFIQDNLGKGGAKWVNILNQGSDAIMANSRAIQENLILRDNDIKMYEIGRLAIDGWVDAIDGAKVSLGQNTGNVLAFSQAHIRAIEIVRENTKTTGMGTQSTITYKDALNLAIAEQLRAGAASIIQGEAIEEIVDPAALAAAAIMEITKANQSLVADIGTITDRQRQYASDINAINAERAAIEKKMNDDLAAGWWEGSDRIQGYKDDLAGLDVKLQQTADAQQLASRRMILSMLEQELAADGLTAKETNALLTMGVQWGIYSQSAITEAQRARQEVDALIGSINGIPTNRTVTIDTIYNSGYTDTFQYSAQNTSSRKAHAAGGDFIIPSSYGNEGFKLGNGDTASAGERLSITPKGQQGGSKVEIDYRQMAKALVQAQAQAGW